MSGLIFLGILAVIFLITILIFVVVNDGRDDLDFNDFLDRHVFWVA